MKIYYNSKCSKCRIALDKLKDQNPEMIEYLKTPPTKEELKEILQKLGMKAEDIIRKKEDEFTQFKGKEFSQDQWIDILIKHPKLIQRPIIVNGERAVIGRTEEALQEIQKSS